MWAAAAVTAKAASTTQKRRTNNFLLYTYYVVYIRIYCCKALTSVSMTFSTTSTVRKCGTPVMGHGTSSVRNVTFSSTTISRSRTKRAPGWDLTAIRGNFTWGYDEKKIILHIYELKGIYRIKILRKKKKKRERRHIYVHCAAIPQTTHFNSTAASHPH